MYRATETGRSTGISYGSRIPTIWVDVKTGQGETFKAVSSELRQILIQTVGSFASRGHPGRARLLSAPTAQGTPAGSPRSDTPTSMSRRCRSRASP